MNVKWVLCLALSVSAPASMSEIPTRRIDDSQFKTLSDRQMVAAMRRLNGKEIASVLVGKRIMPDVHSNQKTLRFSEEFAWDGAWVTLREERVLVKKRGRWSIVNDRVCVAVEGGRPECREVWEVLKTGKIYLSDIGLGADKKRLISISIKKLF